MLFKLFSKAFRFRMMVVLLVSLGFCLMMTHAMATSFDGDRRKMALVIGNKDYQHISSLDNPLNDAQDLAKILDNLGFEVDLQRNATHREMNVAIETFTHGLRASKGIGLFFYAGHGVQVHNGNYLLPVDVPSLKDSSRLKDEAISADKLVIMMEKGRRAEDANIVILDACRDNPFEWRPSSKQSGLAPFKPSGWTPLKPPGWIPVAPRETCSSKPSGWTPVASGGTVVIYAAGPGQEASDGEGRNGVFTKYLKQHLATPNVAFHELFRRVAHGVYTETQQKQRPWIYGNFMRPFCLVSCPDSSPPPRYLDKGDGTIMDCKTGLIGLKNANCFGRTSWHDAMASVRRLSSGACGLSDGSRFGDWRLLTKAAWHTLLDWKESGAFTGVQADGGYWSSTANVDYTSVAWFVSLLSRDVNSALKTYGFYVWPVRAGP